MIFLLDISAPPSLQCKYYNIGKKRQQSCMVSVIDIVEPTEHVFLTSAGALRQHISAIPCLRIVTKCVPSPYGGLTKFNLTEGCCGVEPQYLNLFGAAGNPSTAKN